MSFNPDLNKQAQEVIFFRKLSKPFHPKIVFNSAPVVCDDWQKHLGVIQKLNKTLLRHSLITIQKSFARPHLDYGDIINGQPNNETFTQKTGSIQYNAALAITGAIKVTSQI